MLTGQHTNYQSDLKFGFTNEMLILPKLSQFFKKELQPTTRYVKWDFIDEDGTIYELKSRRCSMKQYPTTLMPVDKVIDGKEQYFIFSYTDKIAYIKYDKKKFELYRVEQLVDTRGFLPKTVSHYHIPVAELLEI